MQLRPAWPAFYERFCGDQRKHLSIIPNALAVLTEERDLCTRHELACRVHKLVQCINRFDHLEHVLLNRCRIHCDGACLQCRAVRNGTSRVRGLDSLAVQLWKVAFAMQVGELERRKLVVHALRCIACLDIVVQGI